MKNYKDDYNLIILFFSIILGFSISGLISSSKSSQVPFSIKSIQETKIELSKIEKEIEDIDKLIEEKDRQYSKLKSVSNEEVNRLLLKELEEVKVASGVVALEGPGIEIVMKDSSVVNSFEDKGDVDVIHDADVLRVINDLNVAGAEAISVNGQRILSFSEIKCGGPIIRVNDKSLATPFVIKAIGDQKMLNASINAPNTYAHSLKNIDKIDIDTKLEDNIYIEGYSGRFNYKNSSPVKEGK